MLRLWRPDEGHWCCHRHLPTDPSRRTGEGAESRAAAPKEAADSVAGLRGPLCSYNIMKIRLHSAQQSAQKIVGARRWRAL